tara:strand:+ start:295 stop:792 length:498 start_codon:yes stop_codon:yes gene_type:complete
MPRRKKIVEEPPVIDGPEFKCRFVDIRQHGCVSSNELENGDEVKMARYHGSNFWNIKGFGVSRWVICGYISVDWKGLMEQGYTTEDIFRGCVKHLNKPPERRKFQKRILKPLFGILQPEAIKVNARERNGQQVLEVLAITNKRKSKYVWGEGQSVPTKVKRSKLI